MPFLTVPNAHRAQERKKLGDDTGKREQLQATDQGQYAGPAKAPCDPVLTFPESKGTCLPHHICPLNLSENVSLPTLTGNAQEREIRRRTSALPSRCNATALLLGDDFQDVLMCETCTFQSIMDVGFKKHSHENYFHLSTYRSVHAQRQIWKDKH